MVLAGGASDCLWFGDLNASRGKRKCEANSGMGSENATGNWVLEVVFGTIFGLWMSKEDEVESK